MRIPREEELKAYLISRIVDESGIASADERYKQDEDFRRSVNRSVTAAIRCFRDYYHIWDKNAHDDHGHIAGTER